MQDSFKFIEETEVISMNENNARIISKCIMYMLILKQTTTKMAMISNQTRGAYFTMFETKA